MEQNSPTLTDFEGGAEHVTASLRSRRDRAFDSLDKQRKRLDRAEALVAQELRRLEDELTAQRQRADRLGAERDDLATSLADADTRESEGQPSGDDVELREGYDEALRELRQLRSQNAELQEQLTKARSTPSKPGEPSRSAGGRLDWEAEKQRILRALETDSDEGGEPQQQERLKIADVVQSTDAAVAAKDREIQELKDQLERRLGGGTGMADAADGETARESIDNDAAVREEREKLKRLQDQWSEKLRQAEVELALERAKIARQRAEVDEQIRVGAEAGRGLAETEASNHAAPGHRSRWLTRLGLTDADRETRR